MNMFIPPFQQDNQITDTSETVYISGMALLKMLKHSKDLVPIEVRGVLIGRVIDFYTIHVVDVFPLPQESSNTFAEFIDEEMNNKVKSLLSAVHLGCDGDKNDIVGWYHSHPGHGLFLSHVANHLQGQYEKKYPRFICIVVDPVQSYYGRVVIGAFRSISITRTDVAQNNEPRDTTAMTGLLDKPSIKSIVRGLNRTYYQLCIAYRMSQQEQKLLISLSTPAWTRGLSVPSFSKGLNESSGMMKKMIDVSKQYRKGIAEEEGSTVHEMDVKYVGKVNPKIFMRECSEKIASSIASQLVRLSLSASSVNIDGNSSLSENENE